MKRTLLVLLLVFTPLVATRGPRGSENASGLLVTPTIINDVRLALSEAGGGSVSTDGASTPNAIARYADASGLLIKNSSALVDDAGNVTLSGITKASSTVSWPTTVGAAGTFLGSDGAGNLVYASSGNVSTAVSFTTNNRLVATDTPSSVTNIKETSVTLDASNNITGVNTLTATTVNANLSGNATTATDFTGVLSGDVTGTQGATVVSYVGGQTAADVAAATALVSTATSTNTAGMIVLRDESGNFSAGIITASLLGNAATAINFSGVLSGDVTGTQGATVVETVGGQTAANVAATAALVSTATSANVADTMVKRDGSGNFSAGTMTASLTGAASLTVLKAGDTMTGALRVPAGASNNLPLRVGADNCGFFKDTNLIEVVVDGLRGAAFGSLTLGRKKFHFKGALVASVYSYVPVSGGTTDVESDGYAHVFSPTAAVSSHTIQFPENCAIGQMFEFTNASAYNINSITWNDSDGSGVINAPTALTPSSPAVTFIRVYNDPDYVWVRIG